MFNRCSQLKPLGFSPLCLAGIFALVACGSEPAANTPILDHDQDGVEARKGDCDDFNNTIFPGAAELAGDGVDQDCSGADTPAPDPVNPFDVDGDGVTTAQGDCNDKNSAVYPDARERTGDGVDSNCDGQERPSLGKDLFAQAVGLIDTDKDGAISLEEFEAACAEHAMAVGQAEPGVVNTHASCAGTNACRGMMLHPWGELFEHDCRGINNCAGWSCTEAAPDQGREGPTLFAKTGCSNCHHEQAADFAVLVPPGADTATAVAEFLSYPDSRLRGSIAFGVAGISPSGMAHQNMPSHYEAMSRAEMNTLIAWLRAGTLIAKNFEYGETQGPAKP